ncbi:RNA cytidine acetyltransferase [Wickerhamiella sorbophila]|uniref:RNA cytidine acetyltransferase n=1 Tax=Wickerhamiella sorbophila TaxID=45607 RepID=A0A2T0FH80_9ASCO|nr:RNA cytidine acetyltransferase [Wickerhamiella sorbophila]PRT54363.1 RNA cytidine acetyltransferase [Wickerhamiella sorbophila]
MPQKKIDSRIPALIRNGVQTKERSFIVIVGDKSRNQLPNLHYLMSSADLSMNKSVLWAYKNKLLGFTSHRKKRETKIKKEVKRGIREANSEDPFELFVSLQNIRYVYYKETENILGNTYGMCVLQDFEAITPNILARTIETVQGGGLVVLLLKSMTSLKQLYSMTMDVHSRYRTEAHDDVVARFNERFILSLGSNPNCLVVDDELNVLPISGARGVKPLPPFDEEEDTPASVRELRQLVSNLEEVPSVYPLAKLCKTVDQAKAVLTFIDAVGEKSLKSTVALTAGRGRGKSAAIGLAVASAIAHGYSNIFITSPSPENLKTLFEFIFKGFDALGFEEHQDYDIIQSTNPAFNKAIVRVNVFKTHRQTIQYIQPQDSQVLGQAELVVIDEAAAIPLPVVKKLLGPYLVFMASTINGYEGTGRSLSLKLISQLRQQAAAGTANRTLREIQLDEPIRYARNDPTEAWLNKLLCLDATLPQNPTTKGFPHPSECDLYAINRNTLFSFHPVSEAFLHKLMALYVASHYKNTPNDLQLLSDAPAHQLYCLLPPVDQSNGKLPEPLCVIQVALEGQISKQSILNSLAAGKRGGGDLIPWVVSQQFQDDEFASLSGGRVVRIATNPDYMSMGYGARALELLQDFFEGKFTNLDDTKTQLYHHDYEVSPRVNDKELTNVSLLTDVVKSRDPKTMPPLLMRLNEVQPERLQYLGVSFGLTNQLFRFWKRGGYAPVYLRQTANDLTGEHTCIMLKTLGDNHQKWLGEFSQDFGRRFLQLLSYQFKEFAASQALSVIEAATKGAEVDARISSKQWLDDNLSPFDLKRLDSYAKSRIDHHVITDLIPIVAFNYFVGYFPKQFVLSSVQQAILLGMGLQKKHIEDVAAELNLPVSQALAMFAKLVRKTSNFFRQVLADAFEAEMPEINDAVDDDDVFEAAPEAQDQPQNDESGDDESYKKRELINSLDLSKYTISGDIGASDLAKGAKSGRVAVKKDVKRKEKAADIYDEEMAKAKKSKKKHNK